MYVVDRFIFIKGQMESKVFSFINENQMIEEKNTVIVGVSGGADSVCLLLMLKKLSEKIDFTIKCAHVNHMIRPTAERDEKFVEELCRNLNLPLSVKRADIPALALQSGLSEEEQGRIVRYEFFKELLNDKPGKIAVAHHRDDLSETVLFNLFRGTGISGLSGIKPVTGNVIRPLLCVSKEEITEYLTGLNIGWMTDETNLDVNISRNRIRQIIIPEAGKISGAASEHIAESARMLSDIKDYMDAETDRIFEEYTAHTKGGAILLKESAANLHPALLSALIHRLLITVAGRARDISAVQVKGVSDLLLSQVGRKREFIYGIQAFRTYDGVVLSIKEEEKEDLPEEDSREYGIDSFTGAKVRIFKYKKNEIIPQNTYTKWFDYGKISNCLVFRKPKDGDYLTINSSMGHKLLKDYFVNEKVPAAERKKKWVLADGDHILWVVGMRISEYYKVSDKTEEILEIVYDLREE